jgi:hypothetical protein
MNVTASADEEYVEHTHKHSVVMDASWTYTLYKKSIMFFFFFLRMFYMAHLLLILLDFGAQQGVMKNSSQWKIGECLHSPDSACFNNLIH